MCGSIYFRVFNFYHMIKSTEKRIIVDACNKIRNYISKTKGSCKGIKNTDAIYAFAKLLNDDSITLRTPISFRKQWLLKKVNNGELDKLTISKDLRKERPVLKAKNSKNKKLTWEQQYTLFLRSAYWRKLRQTVISRDKRCCVKCKRSDKLHVHHLSYEHHLSEHEHLEDLITLCEDCHNKEHERLRLLNSKY